MKKEIKTPLRLINDGKHTILIVREDASSTGFILPQKHIDAFNALADKVRASAVVE